jgi:hypothetical protein
VRETEVRTAGPAVVVIVELEAPTRIVELLHSEDEGERLVEWILADEQRERLLDAASEATLGIARRGRRWTRALAHYEGNYERLVWAALRAMGRIRMGMEMKGEAAARSRPASWHQEVSPDARER